MPRPTVLLLLVVLAACGRQTPPISQAWLVSKDVELQDIERLTKKMGVGYGYGLSSAGFMDLQPDGTYSANLYVYDYGKWSYDNNTLILRGHNQRPRRYVVNELSGKEVLLTDVKENVWYVFNGFPNGFEKKTDNPFVPENNFWRLKAPKKETDEEIASRLRNHFMFWEKYFNWGNNEGVKLNIGTVPSPLQMYGNGFELIHYNYQPMAWVNVFYDTLDCYRAYEKLYYLFAYNNIKWPKTKDRFENLASAFRQLQGWVDERQKGISNRGTRNVK